LRYFKPHISRGIPTNAIVNCADNTGVLKAKVIAVFGLKQKKTASYSLSWGHGKNNS